MKILSHSPASADKLLDAILSLKPFRSDAADHSSPLLSNDNSNTFIIANEDKKGIPSDISIQTLIHGCPGSGKSYMLTQWAGQVSKHIPVVFHPETTYADFMGVFRPYPVYDPEVNHLVTASGAVFEEGQPYITYKFVPGPLLEAYCFAVSNPEESVALTIEELSRANASLVFGDTLQLLDRDDSGRSSYTITPKPEVYDYLLRHQLIEAGREGICFPPNLFIWATMNRSDQNARQLDAAFLRRWTKLYLSFEEPSAYGNDKVAVPGGSLEWDELRARLNEKLIGLSPEDKFIGPYFLPRRALGNRDEFAEDLLGYLWNDVLKTRAPEFFKYRTLSTVLKVWREGSDNPFREISLD